MSERAHQAVFLSYASQDAEAVQRICESLRSAGVEVWFDQNELVGGDAWDAKIRKQIAECALFVPVISAATQARLEGYFRIEWKLAARRTHAMATAKAFLLPIVIDGTRDAEAHVPDEFRDVQWTRLPGGETSEKFCARVRKLLGGSAGGPPATPTGAGRRPVLPAGSSRVSSARWWLTLGGVGFATLVAIAVWQPWKKPVSAAGLPAATTTPAPLSEARKLAARADALFDQRDDASRATLDLAETFCQQAIALDPSDGEIRAIYARLLITYIYSSLDSSPERLAAAKTQAELAVKLAPESFEARLALANYFRGQAVTRDEGIRRLRELVIERPRHQRAMRTLGHALRLVGSTAAREESIACYERADALEGGDPLSCYGKYLSLQLLGRDAEAEAALDRAIALNRVAKFVSRKVALAMRRGELPAAQEALKQIPALELLDDEYAFFAAWVWLWSGAWEKALDAWKGIPSGYSEGSYFTGPTDYVNGVALHALGREQAAVAAWRAALRHVEKRIAERPGSKPLIGWKGVLLARLGQNEEAARLFLSYWQTAGRPGSHNLAALNYRVLAAQIRMGAGNLAPEAVSFLRARTPEYAPAAIVFRHDPEFKELEANPLFQRLAAELAPVAAPKPTSDAPSIAVLAFDNRGTDSADDNLATAIADDLIMVLGRVPGLRVAARTSAFHFKGKPVPVREIARELGVAYVVEGSVQKDGARVKVNVTLVKAEDGFHVWSRQFVQELKDVLALQERIAADVAQNLSLRLGAAGQSRGTIDPRAFELYAEARVAWGLRTPEGFARAERALLQALAIEPRYVPAHAALVDVGSMRGQWSDKFSMWGMRNGPDIARLFAKCEHALSLDPQSAEARVSLGGLERMAWRFAESERTLREAVRLNPNNATAHQWLGRSLLSLGNMDDALVSLATAARLDPLAPRILDNHAWGLILAGRPQEALGVLDRALALQPDADQALGLKAAALARLGERSTATELARRVPNDTSHTAWLRVLVLALAGQTAEAESLIAGYRDENLMAKICGLAGLGRHEDALQAFDVDWQTSSRIEWMFYDPIFDPMRSDPRFQSALRTVGLAEAHERAQVWRAAHPPEKREQKR